MVTATETIHWKPWSREAFAAADRAGKPILLAIGAVWCHWCHVMDQTSYSDPEVISLVNERFIPIRVDTDKRPDINSRYNLGGWPTTAFLTANGDLMTGGTYIPPENLRPILLKVSDYYHEHRDDICERVAQLKAETTEREDNETAEAGLISYEIVREVVDSLRRSYDPEFGGFGREPKFPHARALELALAWHRRTGDSQMLEIGVKTLGMMASGGIFDDQAGGFFRYSTTRDWTIPHFEKMLEDNALLLMDCLIAFQVTGRENFRNTARSVISYVDSTLSDPETGAFYGSQDADEAYYALNLAGRSGRPAPSVDRTVYTDWNSMMIVSYLRASEVLGEPRLRDRALRALDFLLAECWSETVGAYHFCQDGRAEHPGLLGDQVWLARALLEACLLETGSADAVQPASRYLEAARNLCRLIERDHWTEEKGGFADASDRVEAIGALEEKHVSFEENSIAADLFLRMYQLSGDRRYHDLARKTISALLRVYRRYDVIGSAYALAVDRFLRPIKVTVTGPAGRGDSSALFRLARSAYLPGGIVLFSREPQDEPAAEICTHDACLPKTTDLAELRDKLDGLIKVRF